MQVSILKHFLTVPQGVTLRGQSAFVNIKPTVQSEFNDAFLLNGESLSQELTAQDFYSGGKYFPNINNTQLQIHLL